MEDIYMLTALVLGFSAAGGIARTLRDSFKRKQNGETPIFEAYDVFFDITLGAVSGGAVYLAAASVGASAPPVDSAVAFMLVCAGYAGADLIDGVLGKGLDVVKGKLP